MTKVILASSNKGKIREFNEVIKNQGIEIIPQQEYGIPDINETGTTFIENALQKARHASSIAQLPALADDSGLVVPALNGEPGIYSARYAGPESNSQKNIEKLLFNLKTVPDEKRDAYFYCMLVFLRDPHDPCPILCEGIWRGKILFQPKGDLGFGYDPIFFDLDYQLSAAELDPGIKNKISHRGQAIEKLIKRLSD